MAECTKCGKWLKAGSVQHTLCGWGLEGGNHSAVCPCAHEGCQDAAIDRIRAKTGWANLCQAHYVRHHQQRAVEWCNEKGLYTHEAQVKFCSPILHKIFRHHKDGLVEF